MDRVSLRRVTVCDFRSFFGKHTVLFDDNGLYLVRGTNEDSHGDSGAGKSSLLLAIAYALDFAPYSLADLTNWDATEPMWVEVEFHSTKGPVVIHRGDKLWLKIGKKTFTSAKSVEEELEKLLKVPSKLREALTYRRQRKPGMFLAKRDSDKKAFLVELLGLQWLEKEIAAQVKVVSAAEKAIESVEPLLQKSQDDLVFTEKMDTPEAVEEGPILDAIVEAEKDVLRLKTELRKLSDVRKEALTNYQGDRTEADKLKALFTECVKRETRVQQADNQRRMDCFKEHQAYTAERNKLPGLQQTLRELVQRFNLLKEHKCSECERPWDESQEKLEQVGTQILEGQKQVLDIQDIKRPNVYEPDEKILKLQKMRKDLEEKLVKAEATYEHFRMVHVSGVDGAIDALTADLQTRNEQIGELKAELARADSANVYWRSHRSLLKRARELRNDYAAKLIEAKGKLDVELDYLEMLRGFLSQYFADVLQQISDEANKIIGNLPNTAHVTLQFDVERETQDGKMRNEITPVIYFSDKKWDLDAGASGGQYTSIELAVDLAVGKIIADRTGCDIGWLILDESFNGHDKITKESCLQILQRYASDKLIIIVDHASEFKEFFSKVVEVKLQNGRSTLETA